MSNNQSLIVPSRRDLLRLGLGAGGLMLLGPDFAPADDLPTVAISTAKSGLLVRGKEPYNAEPPLPRLLENWITPTKWFFVRNHAAVPKVDPERHRVEVTGLVERPTSFLVPELFDRFPRVETTATLTCAGNRRQEFAAERAAPGVAWDAGAIGNAKWSGIDLAAVLRHCGVKPGAKHVWFDGLDRITEGGESFPFGASIPLDKALGDTRRNAQTPAPGALLADRMNDQRLLPEHGYPLRTIVPGYIGARSVKWLAKITVSDRPSPNHYVADAYKVIAENTPAALQAAPILYSFALNSVICEVERLEGDQNLRLHGFALAAGTSGNRLSRVEVQVEDRWRPARLASPSEPNCWQFWQFDLRPAQERQLLRVRAFDTAGNQQPERTPFNAKGYQYNGWHGVKWPAEG